VKLVPAPAAGLEMTKLVKSSLRGGEFVDYSRFSKTQITCKNHLQSDSTMQDKQTILM
jgi:hypothetical protein